MTEINIEIVCLGFFDISIGKLVMELSSDTDQKALVSEKPSSRKSGRGIWQTVVVEEKLNENSVEINRGF